MLLKPVQPTSVGERQYRRALLRHREKVALGLPSTLPTPPQPPLPPQPRPQRRSTPTPLEVPVGARIGTDLATGEPVTVEIADLAEHLTVVGKPGTGKSVAFELLAGAFIRQGHGVVVFDPHGRLVERLLFHVPREREEDVVCLDAAAGGFRLNPYFCTDPGDPDLVARRAEQVHDIFLRIWHGELPLNADRLIPNTAHLLLHNAPRCTLLDVPRALTDAALRADLLRAVPNPVVRDFWERQYGRLAPAAQATFAQSTHARVEKLILDATMQRLLGAPVPTVDFGCLLAERRIVLIDLSRLGGEKRALIGTLLMRLLLDAGFARNALPEHELAPAAVFCDEFRHMATADAATFIYEMRKAKLSLALAVQDLDQIADPAVKAAIRAPRNLLCLNVSAADARVFAGEFDAGQLAAAKLPATKPLDAVLGGHPSTRAVVLAHAIEALIEGGATDVALLAAEEWTNGARVRSLGRADESGLRRATNLYLYLCMVDEPADLRAVATAARGFLDGAERERLLRAVFELATILVEQPATKGGGDGRLKELLREDLTQLGRFEGYLKLFPDGRRVQRKIRLQPAAVPHDPDTLARIRAAATGSRAPAPADEPPVAHPDDPPPDVGPAAAPPPRPALRRQGPR